MSTVSSIRRLASVFRPLALRDKNFRENFSSSSFSSRSLTHSNAPRSSGRAPGSPDVATRGASPRRHQPADRRCFPTSEERACRRAPPRGRCPGAGRRYVASKAPAARRWKIRRLNWLIFNSWKFTCVPRKVFCPSVETSEWFNHFTFWPLGFIRT